MDRLGGRFYRIRRCSPRCRFHRYLVKLIIRLDCQHHAGKNPGEQYYREGKNAYLVHLFYQELPAGSCRYQGPQCLPEKKGNTAENRQSSKNYFPQLPEQLH